MMSKTPDQKTPDFPRSGTSDDLLRSGSGVFVLTDHADEDENELGIKLIDEPAENASPEYKPHYPKLYKAIYASAIFWGIPAFAGEVTFGVFSRTYAAIGTTYIMQAIGINTPDLPADYGDISSLKAFTETAHPIAESTGWIAATAEIINGVTQFELGSEARASAESMDTFVYEIKKDGGVCKSLGNWASRSFSKEKGLETVYKGISYGMFALGAVATSYGDIEQVKEPFQSWFGQWGGNIVIGWLGGGALFYCAKAFLAKTEKGMEFIWNGPAFKTRFKNHRSVLIEAQYVLEGALTCNVRAGILSFLFGRFAEQWGLDPATFYGLGTAAGLFQGMQCFLPGTHTKYHEYVDVDTKKGLMGESAISQWERETAYADTYHGMSKKDRFLIELKRACFLGLAQSGASAYFLITRAGPALSKLLTDNGCPEEVATVATYTAAAMAGALAYIPFYKASLYAELNKKAYHKRDDAESVTPVSVSIVPVTESTKSLADDEAEEKTVRPNRCARFTGWAGSFFSQACRVPSFIASLVRNKTFGHALPKQDWVAIGASAGTVVGDNRFQVMTQGSIDSIAKLGCSTRVSKQSIFPTARSSAPPAPATPPAAAAAAATVRIKGPTLSSEL